MLLKQYPNTMKQNQVSMISKFKNNYKTTEKYLVKL